MGMGTLRAFIPRGSKRKDFRQPYRLRVVHSNLHHSMVFLIDLQRCLGTLDPKWQWVSQVKSSHTSWYKLFSFRYSSRDLTVTTCIWHLHIYCTTFWEVQNWGAEFPRDDRETFQDIPEYSAGAFKVHFIKSIG